MKKHSQAMILLSSLLAIHHVVASPVSINGSATSSNSVSIGNDSYATSVDGVATGQGAIATGNGFNREDFLVKKQENQTAINSVEQANRNVDNAKANIAANNAAVSSLANQIADLSKQLSNIASKINSKNSLSNQKTTLEQTLSTQNQSLTEAQNALNSLTTQGENLYLNFTDVLNQLNWAKLQNSNQSSEQNRNELATDLKSTIESHFTDFSNKYDLSTYRNIIDGYINRQAGFTGSYNGISASITDREGASLYSISNDSLLKSLYPATTQSTGEYLNLNDNFAIFDTFTPYSSDQVLPSLYSYEAGVGRSVLKRTETTTDIVVNPKTGLQEEATTTTQKSEVQNGLIHSAYATRLEGQNYLNLSKEDRNKLLNTLVLMQQSHQKLKAENKISPFLTHKQRSVYLIPNERNRYMSLSNWADFGKELRAAQEKQIYVLTNSPFGIKLLDNSITSGIKSDFQASMISLIDSNETSAEYLITSQDVTTFTNHHNALKDYYSKIDWDYQDSPINLVDYKAKLDKILNYYNDVQSYLTIYSEITEEKAKPNANQVVIDNKTAALLEAKKSLLAKATDKGNYFAFLEYQYNSDKANEFINYGKSESDTLIQRINTELKLYNDKDALIVEATNKAKELQEAYNKAKSDVDATQAAINEIQKQIDALELTEEERQVDELKKAKEQEKAQAEANKATLENTLTEKQKALEDALAKLRETDLKDLGLRSQAHGSNAFASGNDSIAMGSNATVTVNDGIAIGQNTTVSGTESIAIGKGSTVSGEKSIAIGVGHKVTGNRSTTLGDPNVVSGNDSTVLGNNNNVASNNVMVLGNNVTVAEGFDNAIVLGDGSTVAQANPTASVTIRGNTHQFAGINPTSVISVGRAGAERQIINVAAGRIDATSTDAINGSQLYALVDAMNNLKIAASTATGGTPTTVLGEGNIIVDNSVPNTATVKLADDVNLGQNGSLTIGGVVIKGGSINAGNNVINGVAAGNVSADSKDAVNGSQLYATNQNVTNVQNQVNKGLNFADDSGKVVNRQLGETQPIKGSDNILTAFDVDGALTVKLKDDVKVNSVTANSAKVGNVTINNNGIDAGKSKITNVANGDVSETSQDAVNGSQLYAVANSINNRIDAIKADTNWQKPVANLNYRVDNLENKVNKLDKRRKAGTASALAAAGLPQPIREGQSGIVAAAGQYGSQTGIAVGYTRASDNGRLIIRAAVTTNSQKEFGGNVGVGYFW